MFKKAKTLFSILGLLAAIAWTPAFAGDGTIVDGKLNLSVLFTYREDDPNAWQPMFEEANRLLYNATNGQLQLGTIRLHNCGWDRPDIDIWILNNNSGAFGNVLGLGDEGHIFLSQTHESSSGGALGQFGLVHELGHYAFGLYDEYKGEVEPAGLASRDGGDAGDGVDGWAATPGGGLGAGEQLVHVPNQFCTTDDDPIACLMDGGTTVAPNNARTEFCTHAHDALGTAHNEGVIVGDQLFTNYQQVYNAESCWDTIARLAGLDAPTQVSTEDPPGLEPIVWEVLNDLNYLVLAVDRSASMFVGEPRPIQLAQQASTRIVDLLHAEAVVMEDDGSETVIPGEFLSIIGFGPDADVLFPMQEILETSTKDQARAVIQNLPPNHMDLEETDFLAMLETALAQIESQSETPACSESIILLSDGRNNSGEDLGPILGRLAERNVEVYAVGVGEDVDGDLLRSLADATAGQFFQAAQAEDLPGIFTAIAAAVRSDGVIYAGSDSTDGEGETLPFLVDSLAEEVTVISTYDGGVLDIALVTPSGERITVQSAESRDDVEAVAGDGFVFIRVLRPDAGDWNAELSPSEVEDQLFYDITVLGGDRNIVVRASTSRTYYDAFPGPIRIEVDVIADVPVAGAMVSGRVLRPDGTEVSVEFFDDGTGAHDDDFANDGRYTAIFREWAGDGVYEFRVAVVNVDGTGPDPNLPFVEDGADPPLTIPPFVRETRLDIALDSGIWTVTGALQLPGGLGLDDKSDPLECAIELPDPTQLDGIDVATVRLGGGIRPIPGSAVIGDRNGNGIADLSILFEPAAVARVHGIGMGVPLTLTGRMEDGLTFEASADLPILGPESESQVVLPGSQFLNGELVGLAWPEATPRPITYHGYLSRDGGETWAPVFEAENAGFEWEVAGPATDQALLLVEARSPERVVEQHVSPLFGILDEPTGVDGSILGSGFLGIFPHPVRGHATLRYALGETGPVDLAIYDVAGRRLRTLVSEPRSAGAHAVSWDGADDRGRALSSGVYLYVLQATGIRTEGRITVVR